MFCWLESILKLEVPRWTKKIIFLLASIQPTSELIWLNLIEFELIEFKLAGFVGISAGLLRVQPALIISLFNHSYYYVWILSLARILSLSPYHSRSKTLASHIAFFHILFVILYCYTGNSTYFAISFYVTGLYDKSSFKFKFKNLFEYNCHSRWLKNGMVRRRYTIFNS